MTMMRGASRESFANARRQLDSQLAGADARAISRDLFAICHVVDGSAGLRRALTDPARDGASKAELVASLFAAKANAGAMAIMKTLVAGRWSSSGDLSNALELLAVESEAAAAEADGTLDAVEGELFRFARVIASETGLRQALADRSASLESKKYLVNALLTGKVAPSSLTLISALLASPRGRSIERGLDEFAGVAAERRNRSIAQVTTAVELTKEQRTRLTAALAQHAGRSVQLNVEVDPSIVGGIAVRLGDELLDGTIINRLTDARRQLAG